MKVAISGPPGSGKTNLIKQLLANKWMQEQQFSTMPNPWPLVTENQSLDNDTAYINGWAHVCSMNEHIRQFASLELQTTNILFDSCVLDTYAYVLKEMSDNRIDSNTLQTAISIADKLVRMYDLVYVIDNDSKDAVAPFYESVCGGYEHQGVKGVHVMKNIDTKQLEKQIIAAIIDKHTEQTQGLL